MNLFLIRHGESENNARGINQSRKADPNLTSNGLRQSYALAEFLKKGDHLSNSESFTLNVNLDELYCSAMKRSLQTALPVSETLDIKPEIWVDLHEVGGLYFFNEYTQIEQGYLGLNRGQIKNIYPNYSIENTITDKGWWFKNKEILAESNERIESVKNKLLEKANQNTCIGLITHGGFISIFLSLIMSLNQKSQVVFQSHNCGITCLSFREKNQIIVQYINNHCFLPKHLRVCRPNCDI